MKYAISILAWFSSSCLGTGVFAKLLLGDDNLWQGPRPQDDGGHGPPYND